MQKPLELHGNDVGKHERSQESPKNPGLHRHCPDDVQCPLLEQVELIILPGQLSSQLSPYLPIGHVHFPF